MTAPVAQTNQDQAEAWDGDDGAYWADHHDLLHRGLPQPSEHLGQQEALLRTAEARRRAGRQDDRRDQATAARARSISARAIWSL